MVIHAQLKNRELSIKKNRLSRKISHEYVSRNSAEKIWLAEN